MKRIIFQYIYYTDDSNMDENFLYPKYNYRPTSPYSKNYELQDNNFNIPVFDEGSSSFYGQPHFMEGYFFNQNQLPYGSKHKNKPRHVNNSSYRHHKAYNNSYNSSHNSIRNHDNNSNDSYKKNYKNKYLKKEQNINSEVKSDRYVTSLQKTAPISTYKPSFINNSSSNPSISTPMYIKVNNTNPILEKILSNRNK